MAKRRNVKQRGIDFDVTGVTIDDLIKMDFKELAKYNERSVKKITSRLVSAMNKRYRTLERSKIGQLSPTFQWFEYRRNKGKQTFYSVKGKSKTTTISLFKTLQEKLQQETSTVKGFQEYEKKLYEDLGINFKKNDYELKKKFWRLVNQFNIDEISDENANWSTGGGSPIIFNYIANNLGNWETMTDVQKNARIDELYEQVTGQKRQQAEKEQKSESSFFEGQDDGYEDEDEF